MMNSSRELDATILMSFRPAASSISLAFLVRNARSPESRRIPPFVIPVSLKALMALGTPLSRAL